jgi:hypothetical protein
VGLRKQGGLARVRVLDVQEVALETLQVFRQPRQKLCGVARL